LTQELENLLEVGELAIVNLPRLLSLHESELEMEIGKTFKVSQGGNPALRVQLASLLMATCVAGGEKPEQTSGAGSQSSPLSISASGARRNSLHRRSPAGSGYQSLFPSSPSPRARVSQAQVPAPASRDGPEGSIFESANRRLHFTQDEKRGKEKTTIASESKATQTLASAEESPIDVEAAKQTSQVGDPSCEGGMNSSSAPEARHIQPTNYVSGPLTNEEIVRALLKRASLQEKTGARSAATGHEIEEDRISHQRPPPPAEKPHTNTPITASLQAVAANQNTTPTIEELQNAMARAVLLAKQKGIPPPDWEQLMKQEDYFIKRDFKIATNPELHRLTRIQEEDGTGPEETPGPEGEIAPDPGGDTIPAEPAQVGGDSSVLATDEFESQKTLVQAAINHKENITGALGNICKETASATTDNDLFQCLDAWLASREQANTKATETSEIGGKESAAEELEFEIFELDKGGPTDTKSASDFEEADPNKYTNGAEMGDIEHSELASVERENSGDAEESKSIEVGAGPMTVIQAPEGFEPLLP
jgi:hypothetical protein